MKSNANFLGRILFVMAFPLVLFSCSGPSMPVSDPVLSPSPGAVQAGTTIKITCETPGAEIWYTLNSKIPARGADGSVLYKSPISVTGPLSIMAIAVKAGMESSAIVKAEYRISSGGSAGWSSSGGGSTPTPPKPPAPPPPVSTYAITMQDDGDGAAAATPNPATAGATVTVHATPKTGFMFKAWQVISGGATLSSLTASPATFTMPSGAVTIKAEFEPVPPGTPSLSLSMASFSSVAYGYTHPAAQSITISNTGTDTATVSGIALGGADAASFTLGGSLTPTIAAGATATFTVQPNAGLGVKTHSATITATYSGGVVSGDTAVSDVSFTVNKAAGAALSVPTVNGTPTSTSITVNAVSLATATGQSVEYAISTASNGTGLSAWQSGTTFSGLSAGTAYYVYARSVGNSNYEAGTASVSTAISTAAVVTFNSNGGSVVASQTINSGGTATCPANPTKASYAFAGWYSDSLLTTVYNFSAAVSSSITIYAKWVENAMVSVAAGSFTMGSPPTESGSYDTERPQHSVALTAFSIGKYQVTQELYEAVMGSNPSYFTTANSRPPDSGETDNKRPVEQVSWYDALVFCNKLSMLEGLAAAYQISGSTDPGDWGTQGSTWDAVMVVGGANGYRLPTEAQWEYACRAGTTTAFNNGNDNYTNSALVDAVAWYSGNSGSKTHEVGKKAANAWGLYDMHGNVYEWCWDWYDAGYYASSPASNPQGASSETYRVLRGGYCSYAAQYARSAYRDYYYGPNYRSSGVGFRLVRS